MKETQSQGRCRWHDACTERPAAFRGVLEARKQRGWKPASGNAKICTQGSVGVEVGLLTTGVSWMHRKEPMLGVLSSSGPPTLHAPTPTSVQYTSQMEGGPSQGSMSVYLRGIAYSRKIRFLKWANNINLLFRGATIQNRGIRKEEHWIIISVKKFLPKTKEDSGLLANIYNLI